MRKIFPLTLIVLLGATKVIFAQYSLTITSSNDSAICAGGIDTLTANFTGGVPPYTYQWSPALEITSSPDSQRITAYQNYINTYCVTVTDAHGFRDSTCKTIYVVYMTDSFQVTGTGPYTFTSYVSSNVTDTPYHYLWSNGDTTPSITAPAGIYYLTVTDANGCQKIGADSVVGGTFNVDATANPDTVCPGTADTLFADPLGGPGPYTYHWNSSQGALPDSTAQNPIVNPLVTTTYCVTVTDSAGATASSCITVTVDQLHIDSIGQSGSGPPYVITVYPSGGYAPFGYIWSTLSSTDTTHVSHSGTVSVTVTDNFCEATGAYAVDTVTSSFTVTTTASLTSEICSGTVDTLKALIGGGTGPFTYLWSPTSGGLSNTTVWNPTVQPTVTTTYCVTVTDHSGATVSSCFTIVVDQLHIDSFSQSGSLPPYQVQVYASGGTGTDYYNWSTGSTTLLTYVDSGIVSVIVTDGICSVTGWDTIGSLGPVSVQHDSTIVNTPWYYCITADSLDTAGLVVIFPPLHGTLSQVFAGNMLCWVYTPNNNYLGYDTFWIQNCYGLNPPYTCDTVGILMNVYSLCYECVWPGDANEDGIVNNNDLLPIGLAYGSTGPPRPNATINWVGQPAPYWPDSLADSTNYKFIDCNGDGVINDADTLAILLNYSQTHTRSISTNNQVTGEPALVPVASKDTVGNGDTVRVELLLGDSALPVSNFYGLAFTLNYDPLITDSDATAVTLENSWLGTATGKISIVKNFKATGQLECAITRINHTCRSGSGPIGAATFVITTDNINGLIAGNNDYVGRFYISDITLIDSAGNLLPVGAGNDSIIITADPAGISGLTAFNSLIRIYPNPANNRVEIKSAHFAIEQVKIIDAFGNEVLHTNNLGSTMLTKQEIDISNLTPGIYSVEVLTGSGIAEQKLVITR